MRSSILFSILIVVLQPCSSVWSAPCTSNAECPPDSFCQKADGDCDGPGTCTLKPDTCPDVWDPVCGCDGETYGNDCEAAAMGINVDYTGQCLTPACSDNNDCETGYYCQKALGDCNGIGTCTEMPLACPQIWLPVCGCDGQTYGNECEAAGMGVNVDYTGECLTLPSPCSDNNDCTTGYYCEKALGDCGGIGTCTEMPLACTAVWAPVCGCDGQTYGNECEAKMAGINIESAGQCPPPGPTIVMLDPHVMPDDVHTGASGVNRLMILWSEPVVFNLADISIIDENGMPVGFNALGSNTQIMTLNFVNNLLHDIYTITISDTVISASTALPIDGDENGVAGGDAIILMKHRKRIDHDNSNMIDFRDIARIALGWLWSK